MVQREGTRQPNRLENSRGELGLLVEDRPEPFVSGQKLEQPDRRVADLQDGRHEGGEGDVEGDEAARIHQARVDVERPDIDNHGRQDRINSQPSMNSARRIASPGSTVRAGRCTAAPSAKRRGSQPPPFEAC